MTEPEEPQRMGAWILGTLGYVVGGVLVTVILTNAVQNYFLDRTIPGVSTGAALGISVVIAGVRRKRLAPSSKSENTT